VSSSRCTDRAIADEPGNVRVWSLKGGALYALGEYRQALACFDRTIAIDPKYAAGWSMKCSVLYHLGMYRHALACADRALEINPSCELTTQARRMLVSLIEEW
jgi:tetratricopeptide (TPR) repeat protein